jgi:hypothetical protein
MREIFPAYYRPDGEILEKLWNEGLIALDANVLLDLYRYPAEAREDLLAILRKVSDRLFVPHQAALEYQHNRLDVIAGQVKRFDEVHAILNQAQKILNGGFEQLQLKKRHASIKPDSLLQEVQKLFDAFKKELDDRKTEHPEVLDVDEIRGQLDGILAGKLGPVPTQDDLNLIYEEGKERYAQNRPPGYLDADKAKGPAPTYTSHGLLIERQFGDLVVWRQLIEDVKKRSIKNVLLVTDDDKEDWWWKAHGKTIGPRRELIEEMMKDGGADAFHMYSPEQFLTYAREFLNVKVNEESIAQVRDSKLRAFDPFVAWPPPNPENAREEAAAAVFRWVESLQPKGAYVDDMSFERDPAFDLVVHGAERSRTGYLVGVGNVKQVIQEIITKAVLVERVCLVWVSEGSHPGNEFFGNLFAAARPPNMFAVWGHLERGYNSQIVFMPDGATVPSIDEVAKG